MHYGILFNKDLCKALAKLEVAFEKYLFGTGIHVGQSKGLS